MVLHAELVDVSRADQPPLVLGRQRLPDAGAPPYALRIPYLQSAIRPDGRYEVRTRVVQESRLSDRLWLEPAAKAPALWQPAYRHVDVQLRPLPPLAATQQALWPLQQTYWRLEEILSPDEAQAVRAVDAPAPGAAPAHLRLHIEDAGASGSGGCNRLLLRYQLQGEQLRLELLQSGLQLCLQGGTSELALLRQLPLVHSFMQQADRLELRDEQGRALLRWRAQEAGMAPLPVPRALPY